MYQNINREEVKNREIRYLPDVSIVNLLSVFVLVQIILNYYPTQRLYFEEVETPYGIVDDKMYLKRYKLYSKENIIF